MPPGKIVARALSPGDCLSMLGVTIPERRLNFFPPSGTLILDEPLLGEAHYVLRVAAMGTWGVGFLGPPQLPDLPPPFPALAELQLV